mmetsp:Transcript_98983/g.255899  ORF Transcript_98983/g.255899 Transcript_98983/m.255899 type:complete len:234 (+) Transcript_98983:317-1018(+)
MASPLTHEASTAPLSRSDASPLLGSAPRPSAACQMEWLVATAHAPIPARGPKGWTYETTGRAGDTGETPKAAAFVKPAAPCGPMGDRLAPMRDLLLLPPARPAGLLPAGRLKPRAALWVVLGLLPTSRAAPAVAPLAVLEPTPRLCSGCTNLQASWYRHQPLFFQWQQTIVLFSPAVDDAVFVRPALRSAAGDAASLGASIAVACEGTGDGGMEFSANEVPALLDTLAMRLPK